MNNRFSLKWHRFVVFAGLGLISLTGCGQFSSDEDSYKVKIAPEKFRQIETLELQKAEDEEKDRPDVNEAPAKELELTLEQCRALTLENNLDLKVQLISPAIAAENVTQQEAQFEAAFFSNMGYGKTDTPVASTLDIAGSKLDYSYADLGVRVPLQTGGTVTFDLVDNRTKTDSLFSIFNPSYGSDMSVSISQPLLRGAGNVYWRLYAARRELEVRKKQYDLAQALLEQANRFVAAGDKPQVEVVRTEAGVAQRLEAIIVSENNLRDRQRELKRTLHKAGLEMQTPTALVPATEPDLVRYQFENERLVTTAVDNRMEMLELELQIAEDVATADYMHNQSLPLVTMDYTYNINGLGATRDDSFDLLFDNRFEDHRFGLQLVVPLGNGAGKSRLRQAFYQRRQRLASRDSRAETVELEVLNAIDQLEANWQRVLASRQRTILDGRLFEAEKRQFELGLGTSTDVLQVRRNPGSGRVPDSTGRFGLCHRHTPGGGQGTLGTYCARGGYAVIWPSQNFCGLPTADWRLPISG
ncbi:MAG: TolC family protein [Planctomycetota bacterium]|jgi:outer membrane protein TolC